MSIPWVSIIFLLAIVSGFTMLLAGLLIMSRSPFLSAAYHPSTQRYEVIGLSLVILGVAGQIVIILYGV